MRDGDDTRITGPHWDPSGQVLSREFVPEAHAWINVTTGNMTPSQQAAALQRGLGGLARIIAVRVPPQSSTLALTLVVVIPMAPPTSCSSSPRNLRT
eukprot:1200650-Pyramimonas_sp.AAC.1